MVIDQYAQNELIKTDMYATQNAFLPNQTKNDVINYLFDVKQLLEDIFNILENKTIYDPVTDNYFRAQGDKALVSEETMILIKMSLRIIADPKMQTTKLEQGVGENISSGMIKRIQYAIMSNEDFKNLAMELRDLLLFNLQSLVQLLLNKNIDWKMLSEIMKVHTVSEHKVVNEDNQRKGFLGFGKPNNQVIQ